MSDPKQQSKRRPLGTTLYSPARRRIAILPLFLLLSAALASVPGCRRFDLSTVLDGESGLPLAISPASTTLEATTTLSFEAEGGIPGYTFEVISGDGTITPSGQYTAPVALGTDVVRVTDAAGKTAQARVTITAFSSGLVISPSALSLTTNGSVSFTAIGGTSPYTFSITAAGSGTPAVNATTGYYVAGVNPGTDTVRVTDALAATATATVTVAAVSSSVDYRVASTTFSAAATGGTVIPGGQEFLLENIGSGGGGAVVSWKVYLSSNTVLDGGDVVVTSGSAGALIAGGSAPVAVTGTYPAMTGSYYLIAEVAAADDMAAGNNTSAASALTLNPKNIDYDVLAVNHLSGTTAGAVLAGDFDYENVGTYAGFFTVYYEVYASADPSLDGGDTLVDTGSVAALSAGATGSESFGGIWPTTPGSYFLIVKLSAQDDVAGANDSQASSASVAVTGAAPASVDYVVLSVTNTGGAVRGGALSGEFVYRNQNADAGTADVYYNVYVSTDAALNVGSDPMVDSGTVGALGGNTTASAPEAFGGTWPSSVGTYYLIVRVSSSDDVNNSNNSTASSSVSVSAPNVNYSVVSVSNAGGTSAGGDIDGQFVVQNVGTYPGASTAYWTAYLSSNATLEIGTDPVLDSGAVGTLGAGASAGPISFSGTWPSAAGTYYLIVRVTADDDINNSNNILASAGVTTTAPQVDYRPFGINNTGGTTAGGDLDGQFVIQNVGTSAGASTVYWRVYLSTNPTLEIGTDQIVDSGGPIAALPSGGSVGPIAFSGLWPYAPAATYYLIASVSAGDDVNSANDALASGAVTLSAPDVNYDLQSVSNTGGTATGGAIDAEFSLKNVGLDDGGYMVYWTAYVSADASLDAGDTVIDTGSFSPLDAGFTTIPAVSFSGTWPSSAGTWYLIVKAEAWDDVDNLNNTHASAGVSITAPAVYPNYQVANLVVQGTGTPGGLFSAAGVFQFEIRNLAGNPGTQPIDWWVYISGDKILDASDTLAASGIQPALGSVPDFVSVPFDGTWPGSTGFYYLIVRISADDDPNPIDDMAVSSEIVIPVIYNEGVENNDGAGPKNGTINNVGNYGITLAPNQLVAINGSMDSVVGTYDTFVFTAGAGCTTVELRATWATGYDDIDIFFWDEHNNEWFSQDLTANTEPGNPPWTKPGLVPGERYYVGVKFFLAGGGASIGKPYTVYLNGKP